MLHPHGRHKNKVLEDAGGSTLLKVGLAVVAVGAAAGVTYTVVTRKKAAAARGRDSYDSQSDEVVPLRAVDDLTKAPHTAEAATTAATEATGDAEEPHTFQSDLDHVAHQIADSFVEDIELPDGPLPE